MNDDCWHGQLSHAFVLGAGSPVPQPPESALLCYPGEMQVLLSQVLYLVNDRDSSSEFMTLWKDFLIAGGGADDWGGPSTLVCALQQELSSEVSSYHNYTLIGTGSTPSNQG